jgi:hypothetical protein
MWLKIHIRKQRLVFRRIFSVAVNKSSVRVLDVLMVEKGVAIKCPAVSEYRLLLAVERQNNLEEFFGLWMFSCWG